MGFLWPKSRTRHLALLSLLGKQREPFPVGLSGPAALCPLAGPSQLRSHPARRSGTAQPGPSAGRPTKGRSARRAPPPQRRHTQRDSQPPSHAYRPPPHTATAAGTAAPGRNRAGQPAAARSAARPAPRVSTSRRNARFRSGDRMDQSPPRRNRNCSCRPLRDGRKVETGPGDTPPPCWVRLRLRSGAEGRRNAVVKLNLCSPTRPGLAPNAS